MRFDKGRQVAALACLLWNIWLIAVDKALRGLKCVSNSVIKCFKNVSHAKQICNNRSRNTCGIGGFGVFAGRVKRTKAPTIGPSILAQRGNVRSFKEISNAPKPVYGIRRLPVGYPSGKV